MMFMETLFDFSNIFSKGENQVVSGSLLTAAKCKDMVLVWPLYGILVENMQRRGTVFAAKY